MDEIRIFDYALTAAEIQALFNTTAYCMEPYPEFLDMNWNCIVDLGLMENWMASGLYQRR